MTRRKSKKEKVKANFSRLERIAKLLKHGWIQDADEIPNDALPVDPDRINLGGSWHIPKFFRDQPFTCRDCGKDEIWKAKDQQWYFETSGAPFYQSAVRCRDCRAKERKRKQAARRAAGHEPG